MFLKAPPMGNFRTLEFERNAARAVLKIKVVLWSFFFSFFLSQVALSQHNPEFSASNDSLDDSKPSKVNPHLYS